MPTLIVDGFGTWDECGTVEPVFENWLTFPDYSFSNSTLLRIATASLNFDRQTYGLIRCIYELENTYAEGKWIRFYPKFNPQFVRYPHAESVPVLKSNPRKIYQVMKRHKFRRITGTHASSLWQVNLNVYNDSSDALSNDTTLADEYPTAYFLNLL